MKKNITLLSILGGAGHGKGTFKEIYENNLDENTKMLPVTYSSTMKKQVAQSFLTKELLKKYKDLNEPIEILNHLKDNCQDEKVFKDLNMRELLQLLGTEFYREIDPDIHVKFEYNKMLKEIIKSKSKDVVFVSDDTRFPNEFENALKLNMVEGKENIKDYIKWYLSSSTNLPSENDMKESMITLFDIKKSTKEEKQTVSKFIKLAMEDIDDLKKKYQVKNDWSELVIPKTKDIDVVTAYNLGMVNVFRPIIDPELRSSDDLLKDIMSYTGMDILEIKQIKKCYEDSEKDWSLKNVQKFGYARANFNHYSETALNDRKPLAIVSKPMRNKDSVKIYKEQIRNLIENNEWVNTVHANDNTLRIVFSAGSLFDTKEAETIFKEKGLREYREFLEEMENNDKVFDPGPTLGLYLAFRKLNEQVPDDILNIEFGLITRIPATFPAFWDSYEKWITEGENPLYEFDFMSFGQENTAQAHLGACADLAFVTSKDTAESLYEVGIPAIYIPNLSKENNLELFSKKDGGIMLASDFDGVIGDTKSERAYQNAKSEGHSNPVEYFRDYEIEREYIPMDLGPMGKVIKKLNVLVKENQKHKIETNSQEIKYPFEFTVVTARGGQARKRFMNTMKAHNIEIEDFHMMSGLNKNNPLKIIGLNRNDTNILFIDDGEIHFTRANNLDSIMSGYVVNDYNYELSQKEKNKSKNKNKP